MDEKFPWIDALYLLFIPFWIVFAVDSFLEGQWALGVLRIFLSLFFALMLVQRHAETLRVSGLRSRFRPSTGLEIVFSSAVIVVTGILFAFALEWPLSVVPLVLLGALEVGYLVSVVRRRRSSGGAEG